MRQICKTCDIEKDLNEYEFRSDTGRYRTTCRTCRNQKLKVNYERRKDVILERNRKWKARNVDKVKDYASEYSKTHKERKNITSLEWARKNKILAAERSKQWRAVNAERARNTAKKLRKLNPEPFRTRVRNRRHRLKVSGTHTADDVNRLFILQNGICNGCRCNLIESGYHVDHVEPIINGGSNGPENLQLLCPTCNLSKGSKSMTEWLKFKGLISTFNEG